MAREIIVTTVYWCDLHLAVGEQVEGEEIPEPIPTNGKPRILAMCPAHRKELYDPLIRALNEFGQPVKSKRKSPAKKTAVAPQQEDDGTTCAICGRSFADSPHPAQARGTHMWRSHQIRKTPAKTAAAKKAAPKATAVVGEAENNGAPVAAKKAAKKVAKATKKTAAKKTAKGVECPVCKAPSRDRTSLSAHVRKVHGMSLAMAEGTADLPCRAPDCDQAFDKNVGRAKHEHQTHHDWWKKNPTEAQRDADFEKRRESAAA